MKGVQMKEMITGAIKSTIKKVTLELVYEAVDQRTKTIIETVNEIKKRQEDDFRYLNQKIDTATTQLNQRIDRLDHKIDSNTAQLNQRMDKLDLKIDSVNQRLDTVIDILLKNKK